MGGVYVSLSEQKQQDATLTIKSMAIQLGINLAVALVVLAGFSWVRPRHSLVYAPKAKFSSAEKRPPVLGSGWFAWLKPVFSTSDSFLLERIGCDAVLYLRFLRLLRRMTGFMAFVGLCVLLPINIVATKNTGDWPPAPGLDFLSISGINYLNGKLSANPDTRWYWSPAAATWLFSLVIGWAMYRASCDYIDMRQKFFRNTDTSHKSLMIGNVPEAMRSDEKLKKWLETFNLHHPIQQAMMGHHNAKLTKLTKEHEDAVYKLENALASYLTDGKAVAKKRPTVRVGGIACLGKKVDAIDYFTKQVKDLEDQVLKMRKSNTKIANYGWISFKKIQWAHSTDRALEKISKTMSKPAFNVRLSPSPNDLIWPNLPMDASTRKTKRWIGRSFYIAFIFVWMIPVGALSATSNVINLIRLLPNAETFITEHEILMGIVQAWFTPIITAIFFFVLPMIFRYISKIQGYRTQTTLDRKVLIKLYFFFIINNLLVFTLTSIIIGLYGQIKVLVSSGSLPTNESMKEYIVQLAKNITDVSTFWINYVCVKGLGMTMELAQLIPLCTITLSKMFTRPSPRELRDIAKPPEFDYPQNYNLLLFFFTIALIYSAMAPLVLPFAFVYFAIATMIYKYMLMYIYVTKIESGGKMWPVLFQTVMCSVLLFQLIMILVLNLKGGHIQSYILIPLPFITVAYQYFYSRRIHVLGSFLIGTDDTLDYVEESTPMVQPEKHTKDSSKDDLSKQYQDPFLHNKLTTPIVHENVKHLLPQVYNSSTEQKPSKSHRIPEVIEMTQQFGKKIRHEVDLDERNGFSNRHNKRKTVLAMDNGRKLEFGTLDEEEIQQGIDEESEHEDEADNLNSIAPLPFNDLPMRRVPTLQSDIDDESRGLVNGNYANSYWHQQRDPSSAHEDLIKYNNTVQQARTGQPSFDIPRSIPQNDVHKNITPAAAEYAPPGSHRHAERNVTSELIDVYTSWTPDEKTHYEPEIPSERESKILMEEFDIRPVSLHEFGLPPPSIPPHAPSHPATSSRQSRRSSAPMLSTVPFVTQPNVKEPMVAKRRHSFQDDPSNMVVLPHVNLFRQTSSPACLVHRRGQRSSQRRQIGTNLRVAALQRSQTLPYRRTAPQDDDQHEHGDFRSIGNRQINAHVQEQTISSATVDDWGSRQPYRRNRTLEQQEARQQEIEQEYQQTSSRNYQLTNSEPPPPPPHHESSLAERDSMGPTLNLLNLAHPQGMASSTMSLELIRQQYMDSVSEDKDFF
ncbi:hypothetical protein F4703DRAFT_1940730 [Phycomyces blakesleeanus]